MQSHVISMPGTKSQISYGEIGPKDGHPLFFIGGLGNHRSVLPIIHPYVVESSASVRVIAFDRPLSGLSSEIENTPSRLYQA